MALHWWGEASLSPSERFYRSERASNGMSRTIEASQVWQYGSMHQKNGYKNCFIYYVEKYIFDYNSWYFNHGTIFCSFLQSVMIKVSRMCSLFPKKRGKNEWRNSTTIWILLQIYFFWWSHISQFTNIFFSFF